MTLHEQYIAGKTFPKVTVVKLGVRKSGRAGWFVVLPHYIDPGKRFDTWGEAIRAAYNGR